MKTASGSGRTGYGYGRFSSKPQERGDSFRRQTDMITAYAKRENIELVKIYFDEATSGKAGLNLERELGELLKVVKPGQVIICENLDRLSRENPWIVGKLLYDITGKGVELICCGDGAKITADNIETLSVGVPAFIKSAVARAEIVERGKKVHASYLARLEDVFSNNKPMARYGPCWVSFDHKKEEYVYNEAAMATVKSIFDMVLYSGLGLLRICQKLNGDKVPVVSSRKGTNHWSRTTVNKLIKNKAAYGCFVATDGRERENHYRAIISKDTFFKVQEILRGKQKGKGGGRPSKEPHLYRGLLKCGCGGTLMRITKSKKGSGKKYTYLVCHNKIIGVCKPYQALSFERFDNDFRHMFLADPATILGAFVNSDKKTGASEGVRGELETVKARLEGYKRGLEDGTVTLTGTLDGVIITLERRHKELGERLAVELSKEATANELPNRLRGYFKTTAGMFYVDPTPKPNWTNEVLRTFVERVDVDIEAGTFAVVLRDAGATKITYPLA